MDAKLLEFLSSKDLTFFIPPYQRNYEWSTADCDAFFDDIVKTMESNQKGEYTEHFFGSIVYQVSEAGVPMQPDRYVLTDGQQRITTTMLFLLALRDSLVNNESKEYIQTTYVQNERSKDETDFKIKLKQVEADWGAYRRLALGQDLTPEQHNAIVYQNYVHFLKRLSSFDDAALMGLIQHGLSKFSVVAIQLEPLKNKWENPQDIFESMNSLGKPLSLADLVRNYLLMGKSPDEQENLYHSNWMALEELLPGRISGLIRDWMQADQHRSYLVAKDSNYKRLYADFKELVRNRSPEQVLASLTRFAKPYSEVVGNRDNPNPRIHALLADIVDIIGASSVYSFLTELLLADNSPNQFLAEEFLTALRTYLMRRRIMGISSGENQWFPTLGKQLDWYVHSPNPSEDAFKILSSGEYANRLPNDQDVMTQLHSMNFYNWGKNRNYPRLILSLIEEFITKSRPNLDDPNLQLEHIMPQTLNHDWELELGEGYSEVHQELVNNIGNLTFLRHNQELGNSSFTIKKEVYSSSSGLQVTQNEIVNRSTWDENAIHLRAEYLTGLIVHDIFDIPLSMQTTSNWRSAKGDNSSQFDSHIVMHSLIGSTIYFWSDPNITAEVISDSKVEFEGSNWTLSSLTREIRKRKGTDTPSSAYQGASYWGFDGKRLSDIDD